MGCSSLISLICLILLVECGQLVSTFPIMDIQGCSLLTIADWMFGPNWPNNGEVDIIEGVSRNTKNLMSAHT